MPNSLRITFLIENTSCEDVVVPEHGLAVYLEFNGWKGLYDVGQTGLICKNAQTMDVRLNELDWIALSHGHYDHAGGLLDVLQHAPGRIQLHTGATTFEPKFSRRDDDQIYAIGIPAPRAEITALVASITEHQAECESIAEGAYLVGPAPLINLYESIMPRFLQLDPQAQDGYKPDTFQDERSLVIDTPGGLVILTGCAHRGPLNIIHQVQSFFPEHKIFAIFGGFHLNYASEECLEHKAKELQRLDIKLIGLAHCTGGKASRFLRQRLGKHCLLCPAGTEFEIEHQSPAK